MPKVDNTDFYMFNSYETGRGNFVTIISNFQPLQGPYGGPNYFTMDPEALYEIHIDNTGDAVEDLTFQFRFTSALVAGTGIALPILQPDGGGFFPSEDGGVSAIPISLINAAPIGVDDGGFNKTGVLQGQIESYTVNVVRGPRRSGTVSPVTDATAGGTIFQKPLDNIGSKTFPGNSYDNYAKAFIYSINIPGCSVPAKMFVGPRKEGFAVNLGTIFDLVNAPGSVITNDANRGAVANTIGNVNVSSIALEIDKSCLSTAPGVIAGWSTASVRQARVINPAQTYQTPSREGGPWVQVSRLGMPLVNEVVIGLPDKDRFNSSEPKDDAANFAKYVYNPTLPTLLEILFSTPAPRKFPRTDLVTVFLTGITGVNAFAAGPPAEMLRLNTALPATPSGSQNNLGALQCFLASGRTAVSGPPLTLPPTNTACDPAGFPNGRRPGDDVVDVALRVVMGYLQGTNDAPSAGTNFHDAVLQDESQFDTVFPYLKTPLSGAP
jgi:hypothetical protein